MPVKETKPLAAIVAFALVAATSAEAVISLSVGSTTIDTTVNDWVEAKGTADVTFETGADITGSGGFDNDTSVWAYDSATVTINGGTFGDVSGRDVVSSNSAQITINGGDLTDDLIAESGGTVLLNGGSINDDVRAQSGGNITVNGGTMNEDVEASGSGSTVDIYGGTVFELRPADGNSFNVSEGGKITVYGYDFEVDNVAVGDGLLADVTGQLSGFFQDGTAFAVEFDRDANGTTLGDIDLSVVPEANTFALFGVVLLFAAFQRRRR